MKRILLAHVAFLMCTAQQVVAQDDAAQLGAPAPMAASGEDRAASCALPKYPTLACVGVPSGTALTNVNGNVTLSTAGQVYDAKNVSGSITVKADNVTIKRTQVGTFITQSGSPKNMVVEDSTIGPPASQCQTTNNGSGGVGLGWQNFTARRVLIRGNVDGVRIAGSNVLVEDSYIETCSINANDHGDAVQAYGAQNGRNIRLIHSVWDQRPSMAGGGYTAPIWLPNDRTDQLNTNAEWTAVNDNVLIGGTMSLRIPGDPSDSIPWTANVSGNKIVDGSYYYGPTELGTCRHFLTWNNNATVKYDYNTGSIISEVKKLTNCPESGGSTPIPPEPPIAEATHINLNIEVQSATPIIIDKTTTSVTTPAR